MTFKQFLYIILIYLTVILESSFFPYFFHYNISILLIIFINIYESPKKYFGIMAAFLGGFFLDIFSAKFFGYYLLLLLLFSIFFKIIVKKNVYIPFTKKI